MPLEPPDSHHLRAAIGWLELGNQVEANEELAKIAPDLLSHPAVLAVRYEVCLKSKQWDLAAQVAATLVKVTPQRPAAWISLAYATRRKSDGGIGLARGILTEAQQKFPGHGLIAYNLACYECQLGDLEKARGWLEKAFAGADARELKTMALTDPDLEPLWKAIGEM